MKSIRPLIAALLPLLLSFSLLAQQPAATAKARPRASATLPEGARALRNIDYVSGSHARQKLDLYLPAGTNASLPLIIWIHGGAWLAGSKEDCPARRFLSQGYAVASVNYRLSQQALFPAQIEDCKAAVRWLRAHAKEYRLDPDRFGAWGASAGGHLVALLGTSGGVKEFDTGPNPDVSSRVQAVVDFFGPTDLLRMDEQAGPESRMKHNTPDSPESKLVGGPVQEHQELAAKANPITYVTPDDPPMLLVHGDADPLVPHPQSEILYDALKQAGVEATLHIVKGGGHGTGFGPDVQEQVNRFLEQHLKPPAESPAH